MRRSKSLFTFATDLPLLELPHVCFIFWTYPWKPTKANNVLLAENLEGSNQSWCADQMLTNLTLRSKPGKQRNPDVFFLVGLLVLTRLLELLLHLCLPAHQYTRPPVFSGYFHPARRGPPKVWACVSVVRLKDGHWGVCVLWSEATVCRRPQQLWGTEKRLQKRTGVNYTN